MKKIIPYFITFIFFISVAFAIEFTPQGNLNGRTVYSIYDFVYVNATYLVGDGTGITNVTSTATPTGSDTEVQYNDGGILGADSNFTFNQTSDTLTVNTVIADVTGDLTGTADTATTWDGETDQADLNVNHSTTTTTWASVTSYISRWFYDNSNVLTFNETRLNATINTIDQATNDSMKSYVDNTFITLANEGNLNVNHSDTATTWASVTSFISKWFYDNSNVLTFNETTLNSSIESYGYSTTTGTVTSVATDDTYLTGGAITSTGTITFNETLAGTSLAVNSSDNWDALNTPADIGSDDITDDGTWIVVGDEGNLNVNYSTTSGTATTWDGETSQANLNVNSSDYWDALGTPTDITSLGTISSANSIDSTLLYKNSLEVATLNDLSGTGSNITINTVFLIKNTESTSITPGTAMRFDAFDVNSNITNASKINNSAIGNHADCVALETITSNSTGQCIVSGILSNANTINYSVGNELYLSSTDGELTNTKPRTANCIQKVGQVLSVNSSSGRIWINGAGRCNDVPKDINVTGYITASGLITGSEFNGDMNWTYLQNYASACTGNQFVQGVGDTLTCAQPSDVSGNAATATSWDSETSQANLNVNSSNYWDALDDPTDITALGTIASATSITSSAFVGPLTGTADTATTWDGETSQANLNVNSSNYWDAIDTPADFTAITASGLITANIFSGAQNWTDNQNYPTACPAGTFVTTNADSNTCTAPTAADVDAGTFPAGNYTFTNNIEISTNNKLVLDSDSNACILFNGTHIVISNNATGVTC